MTDRYDAIVIGSGLGGLTAGALYARAGHRVLLLERNPSFGGAATTYHRGTLTVEASLHETTDPHNPSDPQSQVFSALELWDSVELVAVGDFYEVRSPLIGEPLTIPHGLEAVRERLSTRFPHQADKLREICERLGAIREALGLFSEKHGGLWWLGHAPEIPLRLWPLLRDLRSSLGQVFQRSFGDDEAVKLALAANLPYYADDPDRLWWLAYAVAQGFYLSGGGYYIKGGSRMLSDRLVAIIREEGGEAAAGREADEILLDDKGAVAGVRHVSREGGDRRTDFAPLLFGNAAPHVLAEMLPPKRRSEFMATYADKPLSISLFSIALGLNVKPSELGVTSYSTILVPDWLQSLDDFRHNAALLRDLPAQRLPVLAVVDYSRIDSGLIDGGDYPVSVVGVDRLDNWTGLSPQAYDAKRSAWLNAIIARLDAEYPGFAAAVTTREMATASSMHDYLNTPEGTVYGFAPEPPTQLPWRGPPRTPATAIDGLLLASSYAGFGGFAGAMGAGATAAKMGLGLTKGQTGQR
jgi:all-trans-retinol 13,14-reductase